jgi:hypothetical protein
LVKSTIAKNSSRSFCIGVPDSKTRRVQFSCASDCKHQPPRVCAGEGGCAHVKQSATVPASSTSFRFSVGEPRHK